jgi:RepB DNA-primase N-terminal domain
MKLSVVDPSTPVEFLRTAYQPDDWVAVLVKASETNRVAQRIVPVSVAMSPSVQAWLRRENESSMGNAYVSVNALRARTVSRRRSAVGEIRHVFLDADEDADAILQAIDRRADLPTPSYILRSSLNRVHIFWRVTAFRIENAEALQRRLARELHADSAATSCSQLTRLPGFFNRKRPIPWRISIEYRRPQALYSPADFPSALLRDSRQELARGPLRASERDAHVLERARRYLAAVPPAISGQHGDVHTFRVCCRLVRGFALDDRDALEVLGAWNARCQPPWSDRELADKIRRARKYGREPVGGMIGHDTLSDASACMRY